MWQNFFYRKLYRITSFNLRKLTKKVINCYSYRINHFLLSFFYYSASLISFNISFLYQFLFISLSVYSFIFFFIKFSCSFCFVILLCHPSLILLFSFYWCSFTHPFLSFFSFFIILLVIYHSHSLLSFLVIFLFYQFHLFPFFWEKRMKFLNELNST